MTSIIQKKPPAPRPPVRPLVRPPVTPPKPPVIPPRPGPIRADDTGRVPPSERNIATRGGTPATVRDAPGYRGIGTPTMPSSSMLGAKKGGAISTSKISTASKNKNQCNW